MSNNNVAVISLMAKFDEKSVEQAAKKLGKTTEEALSDIGQDKFGENIVNEFNKAMDIIKKKLKGVNLSSYTNNVLDSLFSKKDIQEKTKDLQNFISNITNLSKSLSGLGNSALNSMSTKQLDSIISKQKKVLEKEEEIAKKRKELESTARNIGNKSRNPSTISKNYLQSDYEQSYKSLEKLFSTEKGFTSEQQKSIKYLSEMLTLYSDMEKTEPGKGTSESIKYASDLLTVVKEINKVSKDIDLFTNEKASKFVNKNFDSTKKVNEYNPKLAQQDFVKAGLSTLNAQKAKLEKDLTEYIGKSVEKNLAKITTNAEQTIDKTTQKAEKLKNTIDELHSSTGNKPIIGKIVDDSQVKSLEEIEDRLLDLQDKYLEVDKNGYAVNDLDTKELKEFIDLYNEYISLLPKDNKFESDLPDTYKSIIDSDDELKKYADNVQKINEEKQKLAETEVKSNTETNISKYTEDLKEQQQQIEKITQAEKDLQETQKVTSDTIINVDTAQALSNINTVKESLESLPSEKNIKISVNNTDYSSVPLLSNEEGKTVNMFRGVKNAWSGLVNDKGIGFFTDKLELAVNYADELAKDGKVIQANLALHNPLEVEGNGARWDQIDFEGIKQKTDDIIEKAKQLGYDGVIFKNIRDGFTDTESDLSNVVTVFDAMSVKNEQVIGTVKAGTGELTKIESTANSMADAVVDSQNKIQSELKETQTQAEETVKAVKDITSTPQESNISLAYDSEIKTTTNDIIDEQKAIGELQIAFRGLEGGLNGFMSNSGRLATFFTTSPLLARQYADSLGGVYQAMVALGNSLNINAEGRDWNAVEYLGNGSDETSKKIIELRKQIDSLYEQLNASGVSGTGLDGRAEQIRGDFSHIIQFYGDAGIEYNSYIEAVEKGNIIENQENETVKNLMVQLYNLEKAYKAISDAKNNVYGTHTTDEFAELAKTNGYDSVMFRNIKDSFDRTKNLTDVGVIFDENQVANVKNVSDQIDNLVSRIDGVKSQHGLNLPINIELPKEISKLEDGSFVNNLTGEIYSNVQTAIESLKELETQAIETEKVVENISSQTPTKDAFPNSSTNTKPETEGMEQVEKAIKEAVQAKKEFATANEGVQSSIDGSENPLKLEAELMEQIAKSAREAADAKKEFVEANKQVKDSANGSNNDLVGGHSENAEPSGVKKYKKKGYKAHDTGNHDNEKKVSNKAELGKALKELQSEIIASIDESTSFVKEVTDFYDSQDNLVKTQMKVGDKNGSMRTYTTSYSMDKDSDATAWTSHIETQKYQDQNKIIQEQIKNLQKLSVEKQKATESERKSTVNQASKDQLEAWKQIQRTRKEIAGTSNAKLIEQLEQEKKTYQEQYLISTKILKNNSDLYNSEQRLNELKKISLETTEKINKLQIKNTEKEQENLNSQFGKMYEGVTKYNNQFTEFSKRKTSDSSDDFINNLNAYQIALDQYSIELNRLHDNPDLINEESISNLKKLKNEVDNCSNAFKGLNKGASELSRDKLIVRIADYMDKNTAMTKNFKTQLEGLIAELKSMGANADVSNIADQFFKVQQKIKAAGQEGKKFWDIIAEKAKYGLAAQIGMYFGFNDIVRYAQQAISTIVDLDDALLDLKKTTSMSSTELNNFYYSANDVAKQMGVTTKSIIEQASAWSRLGYSSNEQATEMAKLSSKFASISPGMSTDEAQEGMVSIMKAWQINPEDVEKEILDPINQLGNKFAESNDDIVEGMKRSAAALAAVGTDYKDAYSLFTGIQEVLQNSEVAGRALRSISMRIRGYDENSEDGFEQTDEELKNITGDLIDLTKTAEHSQGVSVFKEGSTTEFKSLVDYFGEIHDIWDEMSQKQQNDFLQKAFGKTQAQAGSALIQNYDAVKASLAEIDESAGSADKEMSTVEQTLSYKINVLKETWVGCAQQILDRGDLGIAISGLNGVSKVITGLIDNVGLLKTAAMGVAAALSFKNVGGNKMHFPMNILDNIHNLLWIQRFRVCYP